jgi:small subunit ribosomal protein S27e
LGGPTASREETRLWRTEVPGADKDSQNNQEGDFTSEVQRLQYGIDEEGHQAKEGGDYRMRREREPIPRQRSAFLLVKCQDCGEERVVFSASTKDIGCRGCGKKLTESKGGKAIILATIVKRLS